MFFYEQGIYKDDFADLVDSPSHSVTAYDTDGDAHVSDNKDNNADLNVTDNHYQNEDVSVSKHVTNTDGIVVETVSKHGSDGNVEENMGDGHVGVGHVTDTCGKDAGSRDGNVEENMGDGHVGVGHVTDTCGTDGGSRGFNVEQNMGDGHVSVGHVTDTCGKDDVTDDMDVDENKCDGVLHVEDKRADDYKGDEDCVKLVDGELATKDKCVDVDEVMECVSDENVDMDVEGCHGHVCVTIDNLGGELLKDRDEDSVGTSEKDCVKLVDAHLTTEGKGVDGHEVDNGNTKSILDKIDKEAEKARKVTFCNYDKNTELDLAKEGQVNNPSNDASEVLYHMSTLLTYFKYHL